MPTLKTSQLRDFIKATGYIRPDKTYDMTFYYYLDKNRIVKTNITTFCEMVIDFDTDKPVLLDQTKLHSFLTATKDDEITLTAAKQITLKDSNHVEDMGNSKDYKEFLVAFNFLVQDLFRVIKQGRNVAVHCMDLPIQKGKEGYIGLRDFSGMIHEAFVSAGFIYHTRVTIWKNPVTEMQRTKALGLLHKQVRKDAAMSRVGIPDYLMVFRKPGESTDPVKCDIDVDTWQKYASPVWMDIDYGDTLNGRTAREDNDEKHIAPLQLQTIQRAITLWTNKGDTVGTPFLGIGSEVYQAVKMGRKGWGAELKESYFDLACKNVADAAMVSEQKTFFDL